MPVSEGCRYCVTCVDRFSRWPEAFPVADQEASTVARAFYSQWIARFGVPLRVTTDQGRQFESHLFRELNQLTGTVHFRTTAYHPSANGMVERFHRQFKAAIRCYRGTRWTSILPTVMLGIRSAWKDDLQSTVAEMIYGQPLRLPGELLADHTTTREPTSEFVQNLRLEMQRVRPVQGSRHGERSTFIFKDLATANHVFVRHDGPKTILQCPYDGPFIVVSRTSKTFTVNIRGRNVTVSIERVKPAYTFDDNEEDNEHHSEDDHDDIVVNTPSIQQQATRSDHRPSTPPPIEVPVPPDAPGIRTRSGRQVRLPDRLQAGFT